MWPEEGHPPEYGRDRVGVHLEFVNSYGRGGCDPACGLGGNGRRVEGLRGGQVLKLREVSSTRAS